MNTTFAQQMATMFGTLERNRVPHGLLLDLAMEFTNVPAFNGTLSDSTYVRPKALKEIYNTLLMSRIRDVSAGFVTAEQFETNWTNQRSEDFIALSGLYFKYSRFAINAYSTGKLIYNHEKIYDKYINGIWQNPYEEMKTFAMTTPIDVYTGLNLKIKIPQLTFYSNYASEILKIEIDFNDGLGYRQVPYNSLINVNYLQEGTKIWKYRLTQTNGQTMLSHSKIKIKKGLRIADIAYPNDAILRGTNTTTWNNCNPATTDLYRLDIESTATFGGFPGRARIFIDDAGNDCKITKPLIVVEGFDITTLTKPETRFSSEDYENFLRQVREGANLSTLINGNPTINGDQQYDIIYVNWRNGVDFIERNALVVEEVIKWVNAQKLISGSTEKNVVIGQSMGGIVCRYAIRDMEQRTPPLVHQVGLFVSQDSPQQGANIPLSIQYLFRNIVNQVIQAPAYWLFNAVASASQLIAAVGVPINPIDDPLQTYGTLLNRPATTQMLINRIDSSYNIDNTRHDTFQANLNAKGFPSQNGIRNVAISNGNECGSTQNFNQGDLLVTYSTTRKLSFLENIVAPFLSAFAAVSIDFSFIAVVPLSLIPGGSRFSANLEDRALYQNGGNKIHDLNVNYTKWIFGIWPKTVNIIDNEKYQPASINKHYDNYGGGFIDIGGYGGGNAIAGTFLRDKFCLVPTPSSLSINATTDANFKRPFIGAIPPTAPLNSPFNNFITAFKSATNPNNNNEKHLEFNARNGNWLAAELNGISNVTAPDCTFICSDAQILGTSIMCNVSSFNVQTVAQNYNWTISQGSSLVTMTGNGTSNITLTPLPNASGQVILTLIVSSQTCGSRTITKKIGVGIPLAWSVRRIGTCETPVWKIQSNDPNQVYQWDFTINGSGNTVYGNGFEVDPSYYLNPGQSGTIIYNATNNCGTSQNYEISVRVPNLHDCDNNLVRNSSEFNKIFKTYPNPTNNFISIELKNSDQKPANNASIFAELYNMIGEVKRNVTVNNNTATVDVLGLPRGIYILKINIDGIIESHQVAIE